ncbi:MAG TPA: hypothetical protein VGF48_25065 [Thermoanaerobaculia bacterium]|jgi:hypothetical protein
MRAAAAVAMLFTLGVLAAPPTHVTGKVLIQSNGPGTVLAVVDTGGGADMQILRITADKPFPQSPVSLRMPKAQVTLEADRTTIYDGAGKMIVVFALHEATVDEPPGGFQQFVLRGHWLGWRTGDQDVSVEFDGNGACSSGGRGATSASCSSATVGCSVSCGSGTYACCRGCDTNVPNCTCVPN